MSIIDEIYNELSQMSFNNNSVEDIYNSNKKISAINKIKKKYGSHIFNKYTNIIIALIDVAVDSKTTNIEFKRDMKLLFCKCSDNTEKKQYIDY